MDYKSTIGEKVVSYDGVSGKITEVDKSGYVHIKFEGDSFAGGYMYDPFLNEDVKFEKQELQALIDAKLLEINQQCINLVNASIAANKSEETYYITKDNEDGTAELVYSLKCDKQSAYRIFDHVVREQQKEYRRLHNKWRRIKMFDSKTGEQIAQES